MISASSSVCAWISSRNAKSTAVRLAIEMSFQDSAAFRADATAAFNSSCSPMCRVPVTFPVAGL